MNPRIAWPMIQWVQRLSMALTLGCCAYLAFFWTVKGHETVNAEDHHAAASKEEGLALSTPLLEMKANEALPAVQPRDIFSLSYVSPSGMIENTPKGELPAHLKVVGIVIAQEPQLIVEDAFAKQTFFIDQDHPQDGIKIVSADSKVMIINYQGQEIRLPVSKNP